MTKLDSILKKQRHHFAYKIPCTESYIFSMSYIQMWELDCKEGWVPKINAFKLWYWRRLRDSIKLDNSKGNPSWMFSGRTNGEAPILWLPDAKSWPIGKDPDAGKVWRRKEKGVLSHREVHPSHGSRVIMGLDHILPIFSPSRDMTGTCILESSCKKELILCDSKLSL